jgi:glycine/D-amino acid oxidase-like deaminating enzyme
LPRLRLGAAIWFEDGPPVPEPAAPRLESHLTADVVIVGGGLTGAVIAQECVTRGIDTVVLEAARLAGGSTLANTGLLVYEPDELLSSLADRHGVTAAQRVWHRSRQAAAELADVLRRLHIACGLAPRSSFYVSTTRDAERRLRQEYRLRCDHEIRGRWLAGAALRERTAVEGSARSRPGATRSSIRIARVSDSSTPP